MGQVTLVEQERAEGSELVSWLEDNHIAVHNEFWAQPADNDHKFFYISSPFVNEQGPLSAYRKVGQGLSDIGAKRLTLDEIRVLRTDDPVAIDVRSKLTPRQPIGGFGVNPPRPYPGDTHYGSVELGGVLMEWALLLPSKHLDQAVPATP